MENKPKNYLNDEHLSIGTREYLRVLNAGGRPVESLPVAEARKVLADVQAAVEVDLSGIDEREREIVADGHRIGSRSGFRRLHAVARSEISAGGR